jgi:hypothetical protein
MKRYHTFKKGTLLEELASYAQLEAAKMDGSMVEGTLHGKIRITVETVGEDISFASVLNQLGLIDAAQDFADFVKYRRDEVRKPFRSDASAKRILNKFKNNPSGLRAAICESMEHGWIGLFERNADNRPKRDRSIEAGESNGGTW